MHANRTIGHIQKVSLYNIKSMYTDPCLSPLVLVEMLAGDALGACENPSPRRSLW